MTRPKQVWKGRVTFDVEFTVTEDAAHDIVRLATTKGRSVHSAARTVFDDLLAGFDLPTIRFIGDPGDSIEAVQIVKAGPVRDWKIVSLDTGD